MRYSRKFIAVAIASAIGLTAWWSADVGARAQSTTGLRILVIDTQLIYRDSLAVKHLQAFIDGQRSSYKGEIKEKEETLKDASQELAKQRGILTSEALAEKRKELESRVVTLQSDIRSRKRELDKRWTSGLNQVRTVLVEITREIAQKHEADLVLEKSAIALVKPELEITREALDELNERLPEVDIPELQN